MYKLLPWLQLMDFALPRQQLARALSALEARLEQLVAALAHGDVWIELDDSAAASPLAARGVTTPIRRACQAYSAIDYGMEDAASYLVTCPGVIGARSEILRLAESVNLAKAAFKAVCTPLQGLRTRVPVKGDASPSESSPTKAIPIIRALLRSIQRSDLNLLAAYRKIPILAATPATITFTRANTRAVYRKTIEDIEALLQNRDGPRAIIDRARLATLPRRETHLALVKAHYQNIRANVLYTHLDPRGRGRVQVAAELPLLYPKGRRALAPQVRFPPPQDDDQPARERQSKLAAEPFLESLPVYRYARSV
jgi:hypothetical protein